MLPRRKRRRRWRPRVSKLVALGGRAAPTRVPSRHKSRSERCARSGSSRHVLERRPARKQTSPLRTTLQRTTHALEHAWVDHRVRCCPPLGTLRRNLPRSGSVVCSSASLQDPPARGERMLHGRVPRLLYPNTHLLDACCDGLCLRGIPFCKFPSGGNECGHQFFLQG